MQVVVQYAETWLASLFLATTKAADDHITLSAQNAAV